MLNDNEKKDILKQYLRYISHISDKEYQIRKWIHGEPPGTDFDEMVCQFIDIGDPILANYKKFQITENQYLILKQFRDKFSDFADSHNSPSDFIDTPEWTEITEMAKRVLRVFSYSYI